MFLHILKSKIHCATVTEANLHYMGSITIDEELMEAAGLMAGEQVHVVNNSNGERIETYVIRGERGTFKVLPGASEGTLTVIDPDFKFPRRRSSVRTPELGDMHEEFPVKTFTVSLPRETLSGPSAFWRHVYDTVRTAAPFPLALEDSMEAVKFAHLMKKTSPFGK